MSSAIFFLIAGPICFFIAQCNRALTEQIAHAENKADPGMHSGHVKTDHQA